MSGIVLGLALALIASVALNSSYVLQHVGSASAPAIDPRRPIATLVALFRSRLWALGAALGIAGWVTHIGALSHAPLSLVQAFVAGGLGLMAPVASRALGQPLAARERAGAVVVVVALVMLCLGLGRPGVHGSAHGMALAASSPSPRRLPGSRRARPPTGGRTACAWRAARSTAPPTWRSRR